MISKRVAKQIPIPILGMGILLGGAHANTSTIFNVTLG